MLSPHSAGKLTSSTFPTQHCNQWKAENGLGICLILHFLLHFFLPLPSPSLSPFFSLTFLSDAIAPRSAAKGGASVVPVMEGDPEKLEEAVSKGEGRATLRLKKDGKAVVEEVVNY